MKKPVLLAALSLLNTFGVFAERASANYVLPFQTIPEPENVLVIECPSCILTDREGPSSSERVCLSGEEIAQALKTQPVLIRAERDILIEDQLTSSTPDHGLYLEAGRTILFE
ncbi:MAG: hypothetical protein JSS61_04830, partial [Verrucomicrobia bacterium]|nr:hypothetical protein [Verrucomicrobiota bacterium]